MLPLGLALGYRRDTEPMAGRCASVMVGYSAGLSANELTGRDRAAPGRQHDVRCVAWATALAE